MNWEITKLALTGLPPRDIAKRTGLKPGAVRSEMKRQRDNGVALPKHPKGCPAKSVPEHLRDALLALQEQRVSYRSIAKQTGLSASAVHRLLQKMKSVNNHRGGGRVAGEDA
jgi:DNA-directed RNA polymerase specialized sigma24 family protein